MSSSYWTKPVTGGKTNRWKAQLSPYSMSGVMCQLIYQFSFRLPARLIQAVRRLDALTESLAGCNGWMDE